jgi:1-acyl-sn-glycerol-3-phosphate acyltransferase
MTEDIVTVDHVTEIPSVNADAAIKKDKYPVKRGIIGNVVNFLGMTATYAFLRFSAEGKENIPKNPPYVISSNHQTYVDGMWLAHFLPSKHFKTFCCLAASDLETSHGLMGRLIMRVGQGIAVDRYGSPVRGLIKAKKEIENGHIMLVHPEGTRSHDGKVAELKDGASYMAIKANVPLLPVFIEGGYDVFSRHMKMPRPWDHKEHRRKRVVVHYGKPMLPEEYGKDAHKLTEAVTAWMLQMESQLSKKAN